MTRIDGSTVLVTGGQRGLGEAFVEALLKDTHGFAEDFAAVLGRQVTYVPEEIEAWNETYVDSALAEFPHTAEHMKTPTRLMGGGATNQLETLLGRQPKTVRWVLENHPRIQKLAAA